MLALIGIVGDVDGGGVVGIAAGDVGVGHLAEKLGYDAADYASSLGRSRPVPRDEAQSVVAALAAPHVSCACWESGVGVGNSSELLAREGF